MRVENLDFTTKPVRVYFRAKTTKTKREAIGFLTPEAAELVQAYLRKREFSNQWLFPGSKHNGITKHNAPLDRPMAKSNAWAMVIETFQGAGLDQKDENGRNVYHPQVLRTYALNHMPSAGLNETMAKQIIGHDTGVEEHYKDWEEIAKSWREKCEQEFTFLTDRRDLEKIKTESEKIRKDLGELREAVDQFKVERKKAVGTILEKIRDRSPPTDLMQILKPAIEAEERASAAAEALSSVSHRTLRFSNHTHDYIKTSIETRDFDHALSDGFEIFIQDAKTGVYVLRKPRKEELGILVSGSGTT